MISTKNESVPFQSFQPVVTSKSKGKEQVLQRFDDVHNLAKPSMV